VNNTRVENGVSKSADCDTFSLRCSDTIGLATGRASGLYKAGVGLLVVMI